MININIPTTDNPVMILIYILLIVVITTIITQIIAFLMNRMNRFRKDMTAIYLIRDLINYVIYFIALMMILQFFGINIAGTLLSLGIVGIAVSFAAKDIISNLFSGIILILGKSVKVGDTIEINDEKGTVERISLRSTVIINDYGVKNIVPNSTLTNNTYLQYKNPERVRVDIIAGLPLNIDIVEFKEHMVKKINTYPGISKKPKADIFAKEIKFDECRVKVSFWVKDFNDKDKYKLIITNDMREYIEMGENDE